VFRDGILIRKGRISPDGFQLRDIPTYAGSGLVEVVVKDAFGREQSIELPYNFTDRAMASCTVDATPRGFTLRGALDRQSIAARIRE
jgi:outer membrane usher protein FimD/PapC